MIDLVISKGSCGFADGVPDYYASDKDFMALLSSPDLCMQIYTQFGKAVGVGRLGREDRHGVYTEDSVKDVDTFDSAAEGVGFYDKVL